MPADDTRRHRPRRPLRTAAACGLAAAALLLAPGASAQVATPEPVAAIASVPSVGGADLDGLLLALDREYRLGALYDRAVADFGARGALAAARQAHRARLSRLVRLYRRYGVAVPANPWTARTPRFASRQQACVAAFRAELDLATAMNDLARAAGRPELASAYATARDASRGPWIEELRACALTAG